MDQKAEVLEQMDIPWLLQPVDAKLDMLCAELRNLSLKFDRELRQGLDAILTQWKLSLPQQEQAKALRERIAALLVRIGQERTAAYGKVQSFAAIASHLEQLERQLRTSMPQHVIDLVGYSTPLPGR